MPKTDGAVLALMREDAARPVSQDKLDRIRKKIIELRNLEKERSDLEEQVAEKGKAIREIKVNDLVALFDQAKVDNVGIPEEGNLPAYNMEVGWYYKANIGTPDDPKVDDYGKAIAYIQKHEPDMLKTSYVVEFGLREDKKRKAFEALLKKNKIDYSSSFGVPWNTLTAWVKEQIEVKKKSPPLKLLGATVERVAKLIKPKADRAKKAANEAKSTPKQRN